MGYTICQCLFDSRCPQSLLCAHTHAPSLSNRFITKLRVTLSDFCCCAPKSRKALGPPVLRGRVALRRGSTRSGKHTGRLISASPKGLPSTSPAPSFTLSGYHGASLWRLADVRPYDPSLPSEPSGSTGGSSADGDWAPPGPSVARKTKT